jgi:hypothetical protein
MQAFFHPKVNKLQPLASALSQRPSKAKPSASFLTKSDVAKKAQLCTLARSTTSNLPDLPTG